MSSDPLIAYFSMEIALESSVPTYAGGLGVLAGDTLRSAADLQLPMLAVTLLHRRGYFYQRLDDRGGQHEEAVHWPIDDFLEPVEARVDIQLEERPIQVRAWRYRIRGQGGFEVPVYLLDTQLPENEPFDRSLTEELYGGDARYRLCQEAVLGLAGLKMLRALGHARIRRFHLNEGHAALIAVGLIEEEEARRGDSGAEASHPIETVRQSCVFTTHTPVPAGHDRFPAALVDQVLGPERREILESRMHGGELNMTEIALWASRFVNGVAMRHGEISRGMFPGYPIQSITNGVHVRTWASPPFQELFDRYLAGWRSDAMSLRYAISIPAEAIWEAHARAKRSLMQHVNRETNAGFETNVLTIGFARRATEYKRPTLILRDLDRLRQISRSRGPIQLAFSGKAHPRDGGGKELIAEIFRARDALRADVAIAYLPNYDMDLARILCAGCDVWLNTPLPPLEASGTSGMKAAVNGVPSVSTLDGWWIEGFAEGLTGWAIGGASATQPGPRSDADDATALYDVLDRSVLPCFYESRSRFVEMMRSAIAMNAAFFNTERMLWQYLQRAYELGLGGV